MVNPDADRFFPRIKRVCELERRLDRSVKDIFSTGYTFDLYARYQGCTPSYQSADVYDLQQRLLAAKDLTKREYDQIKFEFRLTPRTSDVWSGGLIVLAMFQGRSRARGVPPWFCDFRGGEI